MPTELTLPQLHIGPYAEKTGTKANTIIKRLSMIQKRNGLNIITTTNPPGAEARTIMTPKSRAQTGGRSVKDEAKETKPTVKRERAATTPKRAPIDGVKFEEDDDDALSPPANHGLPSPAASTVTDTLTNTWTSVKPSSKSAAPASNASQINSSLPQKRSLAEVDGSDQSDDNDHILKQVKTETWSFM